jgi:tripartite-type tricarboxylate transporter receptor subunit TctC
LDRAPGLEDLPTAKEQGIDGLDCGAWGAFMFPKGTPDAIVQRMARAANETVETASVRDRLKAIGVTIPARERRTLDYLAKFIPSEIDRWVAPIKASGVTAD